jgi:hypothetical protein
MIVPKTVIADALDIDRRGPADDAKDDLALGSDARIF